MLFGYGKLNVFFVILVLVFRF